MIETDDYIVLVEKPAQWGLEPGHHWMSGWFVAKPGRVYHDIRAWVDDLCYLGILGLPRRDLHEKFAFGLNSLLSEFYLEFDAWPGAARIRLEVLDEAYRWREVWRSDMLVLGTPAPAPRPVLADEAVPRLLEAILKDAARRPLLSLEQLADEHVAPSAAFFLTRHPHRPFDGFIDHPAMVAPSQFDRVTLKGWVFHPEQPITRLLGATGGGGLTHLEHGLPRPEVAARFPQFPLAAKSQFFGFADIDARAPNPLLVRTYAELANGEFHIVFARRFYQRATAEVESPYPPVSSAVFREAVRALVAACARHRVGLPAGFARWRAFAAARRGFFQRPNYPEIARPAHPRDPAPAAPRVLLVSHNLKLEGAPLFLFEYAAWLRREAGFTVTVMSQEDGPLRARYEEIGAAVFLHPDPALAAPKDAAAHAAAVESAAASLKDVPADVVVANTLVSYWGVQLAVRLGRPALLYIHESATVPRFFFERLPDACLPLVDAALNLADRVCFLTPATRACYEAHNRSGNFGLVRSWIRLSAIRAHRAAHSRAALRRKHAIPDDALVIANIGTVCERKGQQTFVRALELLRRRQPALAARTLALLVGGRETDFQSGLVRDIAWTGLENVRIIPETPDVYDFYAVADVFVCTSFEESLPRVLLEAMAFGVPIVSTDVHGIPEVVRHGREALLIRSGSPSDLAEALATTLLDPAAARARAQHAEERVAAVFSHEQVLPGHVALLREVAAGK